MGSGEIHVIDDCLHVGRDSAGYWWAVGREGSYGGSDNIWVAVSIAKDASASQFTKREIVVHRRNGRVRYRITVEEQRGNIASSQLFQDSVP
jgi:hypothetical protein